MDKYPDWNDIKAADILLKDVTEGKRPNLHTIAEPRAGHEDDEVEDLFIPMDRGFMECRECKKTIGVSIAPAGTDMDFECIDCYNEEVKNGI